MSAVVTAVAQKPIVLGVLGSGKGSNCRSLIETIQAGHLNARVGIVISDVPEAGILELADKHGIPAFHIPPGRFRTKFEPERERMVVEALQTYGVELVVLAGWMRMIKGTMLNAFPRRIINVHPSLLPKYPGLRAWEQALLAKERITGCTVHFVDEGMDTGEIIAQQTVPIVEGDTANNLHARIQAAEHALVPQVVQWFAEGRVV